MTLGSFKFLLVTLILSPVYSFSQEIQLNIVNNEAFSNVEKTEEMFGIRLSVYNDTRIATKSISDGNTRIFYLSNLMTYKTIYLIKNRTNKLLFEERIASITLIKNNLIMLGNNTIFILEINEDFSKIKLVHKIENRDNYNFSKILGDNVFLSIFYDFHPLDAENKHAWGVLDLNKMEITRKKVMPDDDIVFSYFVNQLYSTHNNKIAFSHSTEYKIDFYDEFFNKIDSIVSNEINPTSNYLEEERLTQITSKQQIYKLKQIDDSLYTRIRKIYFCSDSVLYVLLKIKNSNNLRLDKWVKSANKWKKRGTGSFTLWFEEGHEYSKNNISTASDFYQNVFDLIYVTGDTFEVWYYPYIPTIETNNFNAQKDYYTPQNESILKKENYIGIKQISISILDNN